MKRRRKPQPRRCPCGQRLQPDGDCISRCRAIKETNRATRAGIKLNEARRVEAERPPARILEQLRDGLSRISPTYMWQRIASTRRARTGWRGRST